MVHIKDLHFREEIVPLFDYVINEHSRDKLLELLTKQPRSVEEIHDRQNILKAILKHPRLLGMVSYSRAELNEVYELTTNCQQPTSFPGKYQILFLLPFRSRKRQRQLSQFHLLMSFFKRIHNSYFIDLDVNEFPSTFKVGLQTIFQLFAELKLDAYDPTQPLKNFESRKLICMFNIWVEMVRSGKMMAFWQAFFLFEAYVSIAKGIRKHDLHFPRFTANQLNIRGLYHPLIKNPVRNDVQVNATVHLINGPNMAGKSTFLRALGLCIYLGHLGLAVPAANCDLKFFDFIFIGIDLNDDLRKGYSHFMVEVENVKNVVIAVKEGKTCFAIFDELFRGTNSDDALSISITTINGLKQFTDSCFFISTHLQALGEKIDKDENVALQHIDCTLVDGKPVFAYQLKEGWSEMKIGQILFEQAGLKTLLSQKRAVR